ncbi:hypothetical protein GMRT_11078 [Giardia muris]|uniref:Uncharacterized protein n=1 Tax=Giardia muris TaxID=5742 RepID=A0A4Z1TCB2_GIAMU|nr:hypothetical protein GMRT_11078 [Giardia muris]|eukprot:TNJ30121.1 hypothetical protein GMRT_11078 [Giardia muris]
MSTRILKRRAPVPATSQEPRPDSRPQATRAGSRSGSVKPHAVSAPPARPNSAAQLVRRQPKKEPQPRPDFVTDLSSGYVSNHSRTGLRAPQRTEVSHRGLTTKERAALASRSRSVVRPGTQGRSDVAKEQATRLFHHPTEAMKARYRNVQEDVDPSSTSTAQGRSVSVDRSISLLDTSTESSSMRIRSTKKHDLVSSRVRDQQIVVGHIADLLSRGLAEKDPSVFSDESFSGYNLEKKLRSSNSREERAKVLRRHAGEKIADIAHLRNDASSAKVYAPPNFSATGQLNLEPPESDAANKHIESALQLLHNPPQPRTLERNVHAVPQMVMHGTQSDTQPIHCASCGKRMDIYATRGQTVTVYCSECQTAHKRRQEEASKTRLEVPRASPKQERYDSPSIEETVLVIQAPPSPEPGLTTLQCNLLNDEPIQPPTLTVKGGTDADASQFYGLDGAFDIKPQKVITKQPKPAAKPSSETTTQVVKMESSAVHEPTLLKVERVEAVRVRKTDSIATAIPLSDGMQCQTWAPMVPQPQTPESTITLLKCVENAGAQKCKHHSKHTPSLPQINPETAHMFIERVKCPCCDEIIETRLVDERQTKKRKKHRHEKSSTSTEALLLLKQQEMFLELMSKNNNVQRSSPEPGPPQNKERLAALEKLDDKLARIQLSSGALTLGANCAVATEGRPADFEIRGTVQAPDLTQKQQPPHPYGVEDVFGLDLALDIRGGDAYLDF